MPQLQQEKNVAENQHQQLQRLAGVRRRECWRTARTSAAAGGSGQLQNDKESEHKQLHRHAGENDAESQHQQLQRLAGVKRRECWRTDRTSAAAGGSEQLQNDTKRQHEQLQRLAIEK